MKIDLARSTWDIDLNDFVGRGGMGRVVGAMGQSGERVVAKLVPKQAGATRDLLVDNLAASPHVVPILDDGEYLDDWVLIMPRADTDLARYIERNAPISLVESVAILDAIAEGLEVIHQKVVHRDLKPENVLWLNDAWAITDFGIARYTEATTAPDTRKGFLSAPWAAPEQWRFEHAVPATDVYALGVIAHQLIRGKLPFEGPTQEDFRGQHLTSTPPNLGANKRLDALIDACLSKNPGSRPGIGDFRARLARVTVESAGQGAQALIAAQHQIALDRAEADRIHQRHLSETERRSQLFADATHTLQVIRSELVDSVVDDAASAEVQSDLGGQRISFGNGVLNFSNAIEGRGGPFPMNDRSLDLIAFASISVTQQPSHDGYMGRSHSLYYCNFDVEDQYGWYETTFMDSQPSGGHSSIEPHELAPQGGLLTALLPVTGTVQFARPWQRVFPGDADEFIDRWKTYLGAAASSSLPYPSHLPEQ